MGYFTIFRIHKYSFRSAYNFTEFIILLYTFLVASFSRHNKYMICLIPLVSLQILFLAISCAIAIGNLRSICLGINVLSCLWCKILSKILVSAFLCFPFRNILLSRALKTFWLPLRSIIANLKVRFSFFFFDLLYKFYRFFKNSNIIF